MSVALMPTVAGSSEAGAPAPAGGSPAYQLQTSRRHARSLCGPPTTFSHPESSVERSPAQDHVFRKLLSVPQALAATMRTACRRAGEGATPAHPRILNRQPPPGRSGHRFAKLGKRHERNC